MSQASSRVAAALLVALLGAPSVHAQLNTASAIRGLVLDAQGQPLAGVNVELEFKGESRVKIVKKTVTNKKGGYIYSGLLPGTWAFHFTKPGYKTTLAQTDIPLGGIAELPTVTMEAGEDKDNSVAGAISAAAGPSASAPGGPKAGPGAGTDKSKELAEKYTKAMAAIKAGQNAEGEALMKEILTVVPAFAPAHQALATAAVARGDVAEAEASYRKVVEYDPQSAASHLTLANFLAKQGRYEDAFKALQDAGPQFEQDGMVQFALGAAAFNLGRTEEAQAAFLKAAEINPANAEPYFYLGSMAVSRNELPKAIEYLEKYVGMASPTAPNVAAAKGIITTLKKK